MDIVPGNMIIGITGHRPHKLGGYDDRTNRSRFIKPKLKEFFQKLKPSCIVSGMALGVDQWAVEIALELGIKVVGLVPCLGQESQWPPRARDKYQEMLSNIILAGGTIEYVSDLPYNAALKQMQARNQRIVDYSTHMIAIWDRTWGGTGSCVRLAKQAGRTITAIHPTTLEVMEI